MAQDEGRGGFDFMLEVSATVDAFGGGWKKRFKTRVDEVRSMVIDLLTSDWQLHSIDPADRSQRAQELRKIHKIFIPELIMRLTRVLQKARKHYPEYVGPSFLPSLRANDALQERCTCDGPGEHFGRRETPTLLVLRNTRRESYGPILDGPPGSPRRRTTTWWLGSTCSSNASELMQSMVSLYVALALVPSCPVPYLQFPLYLHVLVV